MNEGWSWDWVDDASESDSFSCSCAFVLDRGGDAEAGDERAAGCEVGVIFEW